MPHTYSTYKLTSILIFLFCYQAGSLPLFEAHSLRKPLLNALATSSSGVIELQKDPGSSSGSFYVEADLGYFNTSDSFNEKNTSPDTVKMMTSLVNDQSMVATNCLNFQRYDCAKYNCNQQSYQRTIDYPYFTASTLAAQGVITLDQQYWILFKAYLYIAQSCITSYDSSFIGSGRYGVLGLGTSSGQGGADFISSTMFSIVIDADLNKGKLVFKNDPSTYAQSSEPAYKFAANSTWQKSVDGAQIGGHSLAFFGNTLFDVNSDVIGIPDYLYKQFINAFTQNYGVSCDSQNYKPTCHSSKSIEDLPDFILQFNDSTLKIPSSIYAVKKDDDSFSLNLKQTSTFLSDKSYVPSFFENSIILGASFMSHYYTVFDATSGANYIYLYPAKGGAPDNKNALWIILLSIVTIIVIGLCYYFCAKKKEKIPLNDSTMINNTTDTPTPDNLAKTPLLEDKKNDSTVYNPERYNQQPQEGLYPVFNDALYQQQRQERGMSSSEVSIQVTEETQALERAKQ